ncbi:MAG: potassium-transporting ATPase subunit KdpA, partial [Phycicoccus sp.]
MDLALQTAAAVLLVGALVALLAVPVGRWMYLVFTDEKDWRIERLVYRLVGVDSRTEQRWTGYLTSVLAFAAVSVAVLFVLLLAQPLLPWSFGRSMQWHTALNTAISFVTNTNWQSYAPEVAAGHTAQLLGLTVQNVVSAATGLAVAVALMRGLARSGADRIGNFWVDLVRATTRVMVPGAMVGAVLLLLGGVVQNLSGPRTITTLTGAEQVLQGGPAASQEAVKLLGTNGGGFFNANSAHPFENPGIWTNVLQIVLILVIPFALTYTFGLMVRDRRQGAVAAGVMSALLLLSIGLAAWAEIGAASGPLASMEGKEQRYGVAWSVVFGAATTGTSTGAVNSMHDSYSPL